MSTAELIADLSHLGVRLWLDGDQVRFKAPQGALTPELKAQLVEHKGDLLEFLRQVQSSLESTAAPPISPAPRHEGDLPLSYSQERLWFTAQWEPDSAAYNISDAITIEGEIELAALEKSLNEIIRRHDILRTSFVSSGGQPVQRIAPEAQLEIRLVDLEHLSAPERDAEMGRTLSAETSTPFDLSQSTLLRVVLIRLEPRRHVLLFNAHHIISDGWSTSVLIHELVSLYRAFAAGEPSPLAPLPIQYADFAVWQREWLAGERLESEAAFWREQLRDAPASLDLPTDKPRPPVRTSLGATHRFALSPTLSSAVRKLSQQERVTPFMFLLAGWSALLCKYSGQDDVLVGSAHANRSRTELEGLIGFFVNTLVLRTDLSGNPTFRELLARVRQVTLSAQAHQDFPFEKLVDELHPERDLSRTPIYQVAFTFQNAPEAGLSAPGLVLNRLQLPSQTAKFDLTLIITDSEPAMTGEIEYSTDLFDEDTIVRMAGHLETLLSAAVAHPERRLSELTMLTGDERRRLLTEWNDTATDYPRAASIQELFERQAETRPEAIALISGHERASYRELNERANRLAHYLRNLGVGAEMSVGICLERSPNMIVGLLAILKAGGTYVPLDPEYPMERLAFMLEESNVVMLLTDENLEQALPSLAAHVICLDVEQDEILKCSADNPPALSSPDNLAYVMFTSGSTGKPKGIGVTHRNVVRLVRQTDYARFDAEEVFLQFAPISFDASTFEIWGSLLNGARLVLFPQKQASLEELGQVVREQQVSVLWLTAGLFHQMVESRLDDLRQLRQLLAGGDVLSAHHVRRVVQELDGCRLTNGYGPTEGTTFTCCYSVDDASAIQNNVPIGRPIANTQVYILDAELQPTPVGVPGELYISGDGLARGYVNQPCLTAEKFIPNPFASEPSARMYRTGDLTRYLANGEIEFLGRIDFQLKIRGFRIELEEIESVLARFGAIAQAVVVARESGAGDKQLVAYLVAEEGGDVSAATLKNYLRQHLPDYMIPSAFVVLEQLPLTPNGKVDRKALPAPEKETTTEGYAAPRTAFEELLAEIWRDVLQLERVDINDNFFDLGGHSLMATQIISKISDTFHVSLPLRALFESPTVAGLSERIQTALISGQDLEVPPIQPVSREQALPLSFAQENLWLFEQLTPGTPTYNTCRSGRIWGRLDASAVEAAFNELLQRHEALRTSYEMVETTPVQIVHPHEHYELPIIDISEFSQEEREAAAFRLSNEDAQLPIDITKSPVARAKLLRLGDEEHVFILSIHHIAYDLWSGGVLLGEMEQLYLAHVAGETPKLAPLPVQCADFGVWQRNWLQGEVLERQLSYWKEKLAGLSATPLDLPSDRPRPPVETMNGASEYIRFPKSVNEGMEELARREGVTQFMALLAVFQVMLHRYTNQDDLAVGSVIANRNRAELDGVVGFFDNPIVLRVDAAGNPTFREFLRRVRDVALGAYTNQYLPFDHIVSALQPERTSNRTPFIQAMFVFLLNYPAMEREIAGLKVVPYNLQSGKAMFDLLFGLRASERGLEGELAYNCDLFDAATVARMCRHFGQLLEAVVADPDQRIRELNMLSEAEQNQLLLEWNETRRDYDLEHSIKDLFEGQVKRTPEREALTCAGEQITYGRLNERANQLAHHLISRGVGAEVRVGICLERSTDLLVSMLAVLKAGAAYVPLDPDYPAERVAYMLGDAGVPVLLTSTKIKIIAPEAPVERIYLDADWERIAATESTTNPVSVAVADNLAYIIYTSGSTGRPKGVAITHRSAVSFLNWANEVFPEERREGLLAATSICFDLSIFELFLPLCFGGRIILVDNILALPSLPRKAEVTLVNTVPSAIRELLNDDCLPQSAATVNLAGEALSADLARRLYAALPEHQLYNLYGPSETTTYSTFTHIESSVPVAPGIGRPIANTQVYVLDRDGNPTPTGVPGELYIGGVGLARGYLNRPELTAEKFVPNAFSAEPGARLYRTGDRVRWLTNGTLEFLGRIDHQVKVRGYRIELGEIESVLAGHPSVREAVVVVRDDGAAGQRLVAYLVSPDGTGHSVPELRAYLQGKLPGYMIPSAFVTLRELPLTPNGKLDRKALPAPGASVVRDTVAELAETRRPSEELVAGVWCQVLGLESVGRDESFFELGGHSLLATQVVSRVQKMFGVEIELRRLFENPTVAGLSRHIEAARRAGQNVPLTPIVPVPRDADLPLSFAQQRLWFLDKLVADNPVYNIPSALRIKGQLNLNALEDALTEIVRRHEALRTTFQEVDGQPVQVFAPPAPFSLPCIDLGALGQDEREHEARRLAEAEAQLPLDLSDGTLLRASVLRLGEDEHVVLLTMHHIISDGWSMSVLLRELTALYEAFVAGHDSPLPELPIQYADFAAWQREWLSGEVLDAQLQFWKKQLSGVSVLDLPTDRPRPPVQSFTGAHERLPLSAELTEAVKALGQQEGTTLFMTLLAAFNALLRCYTGQQDIVVGTPVANRSREAIEGLIGFFANTLVLRTELSDEMSFSELLREVREVALDAYAHQDVPFEKLVEELQPERDLSRNPLVQVFCVLQNLPSTKLEMAGLDAQVLETESETTKFDLTLYMTETEDGLVAAVEYSSELFEAATIRRMLKHYEQLLAEFVAAPQKRLSEISLLTEEERRGLLAEWSRNEHAVAQDGSLQQMFEAQAARTPDAVAVMHRGEAISYGELNRRANRIAHRLRELGARPEMLVCICLERSTHLIAAMLGVLKAGGAYRTLDPQYSPERLRAMLEDSAARFIVSARELEEKFAGEDERTILFADDAELLALQPADNPSPVAAPFSLACVLDVSASADQSKIVMLSHADVTRLFAATAESYGFDERDVWALSGSPSLDFSVREIWGALLHGGKLVVIPDDANRSAAEFYRVLVDEGVTILHQTPSAFGRLVEAEEYASGDSGLALRLLILSGGELETQSLRPWFERHGDEHPRLFNMHSLPGTTLQVASRRLTSADLHTAGNRIGRPVSDLNVYVLDRQMQPVPVGLPGEMYVGGAPLARGYLGRPDLTAESFVPDPFGGQAGAWLYRSGELVRYFADGELGYLGSVDRRRRSPASSARRAREEQAYLAPRDEIEFGLARIWESLLGVEGVGIRDSFFDLGGHSLLAVRLLSRVKQQFKRELPLGSLLQSPTIERLASLLRQDGTAPTRSPLVAIRPEGTRPPFFCVHPVGGNVLCYAPLARQLGAEQPFYAFQLPASNGDSDAHTIEALARQYLQHLREVQPQGPYRLGGWSMGGVIAFEMARQLREQGERVELLALIDSYAPPSMERPERFDQHELLRMFVQDLEGVSGRRLEFSPEDARHRSLEESFGLLLERARASEMIPDELGVSELMEWFKLYRTNLSALLAYEPQKYEDTVTLFRSGASGANPEHGWMPYAGGVEVLEIEGDHYSIINGPPVKALAARLDEMLSGERLSA